MTKHLQSKLRLLALLTALFMGFGTAQAAYDFSAECPTGQTLYYQITDFNNLYVSIVAPWNSSGMWPEGTVKPANMLVIPETVSYYGMDFTVTSIGDHAFYTCDELTILLQVPNTVTSIENYAFYGCSSLRVANFPNTINSIGDFAFNGCSSLTSIEIPNSVTSIGQYAFQGCTHLTSVEIPNSVTFIGQHAFRGCIRLTSVEIGNSVTSIGVSAFQGCTSLTSVEIGDSVTSIGNYAFQGCTGLTSVEIPNSVTSIELYAFQDCTSLTSVEIGNSVTSIKSYAFNNCTDLTSITVLAETPPTLGNDVFQNVPTDAVLYVPCGKKAAYQSAPKWNEFNIIRQICDIVFADDNVKAICLANWDNDGDGELTYEEAAAVTTLNPGGEANQSVFMGNTAITSFDELQYFTGLTSIDAWAFYNCRGLTSIEIPNSVTSIGGSAFFYCSGLTSIEIPNSITSIGQSAFRYCFGLTSVYYTGDIAQWCGINFVDNSVANPLSYAHNLYINNELVTALVIPNSVTSIGQYAFYGCSSLTSVVIPNSVTSIGQSAFQGCSGLTSVEIGNSVTSIGMNAFRDCTGLTSVYYTGDIAQWCGINFVDNSDANPLSYAHNLYINNELVTALVIPNSVTSIGQYVFYGCSGLTSIEIPNSVTSIGQYAFTGCSGLTSVEIPNSVTSIGQKAFQGCSGLTSVEIGNSVTSIGQHAFGGCTGLTSITVEEENTVFDSRNNCNAIIETATNILVLGCKNTVIPNSVTSIGQYAFSGCSGLTSIEIPNSVTSIGQYAFSGCSGLTSVEIGNSVTSIGNYAFQGCSGLTSVEIGNSVTSIGQCAFSGCSGLTSVGIPNSVTSIGNYAFRDCTGLTSVEIPNSVTSIGQYVFYGCSGLTSIEIPNSVTFIGQHAFQGCTGLASVGIPNSVTGIGLSAFQGCSGLTSVEIGNSVTGIGQDAFNSCISLTEITLLGTNVPSLGQSVFNSTNDCPIYVPYESLNNYKTASNWSRYKNRIYPMAYTTVSGYGESTDNEKWAFIASPLTENTAPTAVSNMTGTAYDLYRFNQSAELEWENYKTEGEQYQFTLENGMGYLYANKDDVNIIFKGTFNEEETQEVNLVYDEGKDFAGWNLVGNPFPVQAYANRSYYIMNDEGTAIELNAFSASTAIPACTGIMVKAETTGENVTFSKNAPSATANNGTLQIAVAQANTRGLAAQDKAIVSFNAGDELGKFYFGESNAKLYIPQNGKELAIATAARKGELPLNFKAKKNGEYTLRISIDAAELDYLHLIDNLNGADVDLLHTNEYTFTAKTSDYASRFKLVFEANEEDGVSTGSTTFAYYNGSEWVINNEGMATLQVIDALGRVLSSETISGNAKVNIDATPGVYVMRLVNGDNVKTQKVVVK